MVTSCIEQRKHQDQLCDKPQSESSSYRKYTGSWVLFSILLHLHYYLNYFKFSKKTIFVYNSVSLGKHKSMLMSTQLGLRKYLLIYVFTVKPWSSICIALERICNEAYIAKHSNQSQVQTVFKPSYLALHVLLFAKVVLK